MPQHSVSGNWFSYTLIHLIGSYHFAQSWAGSQSVPRHACCSLAQVFAWKTISCWFSHSILTNIYSPLHPFSSPSAVPLQIIENFWGYSLGWFKWLLCIRRRHMSCCGNADKVGWFGDCGRLWREVRRWRGPDCLFRLQGPVPLLPCLKSKPNQLHSPGTFKITEQ